MKRILASLAVLAAALPVGGARAAAPPPVTLTAARGASPVVLTGKQLPALSAPAPMPLRVFSTDFQHPGTSPSPVQRPPTPQPPDVWVTPPDASTGGANVPMSSLGVFRYQDGSFTEIPSQGDEKFWRYLANPNGENGEYSGFDPELTYVFDQEGFRKTAGQCYAEFPAGQPVTTPDYVPGFDDDDELAFMARDAGAQAPAGSTPVAGTKAYEVAVTDPLSGATSYAYVVSAPGRAHTFGAGYVSYQRDAYADRYVNARGGEGIPEGTRCSGDDPNPTPANTGPRRPRDTATFVSDQYTFHWGGRWTPDEIHIKTADGTYGPDLIDQWKGRAFQLTRNQAVSVGYIGDASWNETSVTLGERVGPIRLLRETWGAKSGTNVTRLYTLYDRLFQDQFYARVHPIPPDGIYSMWDNNKGAVSTYYSPMVPNGVPIDGVNDEVFGNVDVAQGTPAESHYDIADPTVQPFTPVDNWDEVAGKNGSIVYYLQQPKPGAGVITSYYRDDANFDDGTGSDPSPERGKQGSFGTHGVHFYATGDTDNTGTGFSTDELQVIQSQYMLRGDAGNVGDAYALTERVPLSVSTKQN